METADQKGRQSTRIQSKGYGFATKQRRAREEEALCSLRGSPGRPGMGQLGPYNVLLAVMWELQIPASRRQGGDGYGSPFEGLHVLLLYLKV